MVDGVGWKRVTKALGGVVQMRFLHTAVCFLKTADMDGREESWEFVPSWEVGDRHVVA